MRVLVCCVLLLVPALASAWDYVCGDANGLRTYLTSIDATQVTGQPDCTQISEADTLPQRDFLQHDPTIQTNGRPDIRKVRVVGGLAVAKTQADRDAIDAADAAAAAEQAALQAEKATNPACSVSSLEEAQTRIDTVKAELQASIDAINVAAIQVAIDAINVAAVTNVATTQTAFTQVKTALSTTLSAIQQSKATHTMMTNRLTKDDEHLIKCIFALTKTSGG